MKAVNLERNVNNSHSWWWDSHAGPRHSKWLKENMADMDQKVKGMLKLIEEDADSFAKRAEMYYKKRPELVSLVEEFYRAYRALAERYDHLTGDLHHVQLSMGDAFPNHLRNLLDSNIPRGPFLNKNSQGHPGKEHEGFGAVMEDSRHEYLDSKVIPNVSTSSKESGNNWSNKITILQKERLSAHQEKGTLTRVCETRIEDEQLQKMQEQLQHVQEERHKLIQDSSSYIMQINELQDQVSMLERKNNEYVEEAKVVSLKLQSETQEKNNLIVAVHNLEAKLHESDRQNIETEVENDCSSSDQRDNSKTVVNIEDELVKLHRENHNLRTQVMSGVQQLQKANGEIQKLHQVLIKSQAENDTMISQYQQSLKLYESADNRAKELHIQMAFLQEENRRIRDDIAGTVFHMEREKNAFQQNVWNRVQMTDFLQAARSKQDEEQNRGKGTRDETSQILNFDTIVKKFQQSLSQSQEQLNKLLAELQAGNERVKNADSRIRLLEEEIHTLRRENNNLLEKSSSAVVSIKNLEEEVYKLKQEKNNLINEVAFRVDQRDALQQELYCSREDRNDIDRKFQMIMKHIESLGVDAASIHLISANFQHIRQKLRENEQICEDKNLNILEVLQKMEELLNKIVILENSTASHRMEADKFESEVKLLRQHVEGLHKEKGELTDECKQWHDQIRELEAKLKNVHNLYSTLQRESQQHEDELADALEHTKHLDEQICSLQKEKEALVNEIVERTLQMSHSQKQADLLQGQVEVLGKNLEEEISKEQMLQAEVKKLQHITCEIDNRNQTLSDDYYRLNENYGATEEKMMELEETYLKQQTENDMLLRNFSSAKELNRELELEIKNLLKLLGIPDNVERELSDADTGGTKGLRSIAGEVKNMQIKLSQLQEENKKLSYDAVAINTHLEQLQKDTSALCAENESVKDAAAVQLEKLMSMEKEKSQLQEQDELLKTKLEAGMEKERILQSEIDSLQQSLTSSLSSHLALEGEHQRILDEQNFIKRCLKESESKLLESEEKNETLLMEALSQICLISILESHIVEKGENMQVMEKQLKALEGEHQRILDEQNSIRKCLKESESKLLETEAENETFLMEALSQVSLISILESHVVEKRENMQVMEKQLKALEVEHQRILDEHNSIKKCLKESESKFVETEEENENFLMEALSQVCLISILESQVVEKGENMQVMEKQLKALEVEHQRILDEHNSIKKCLKESESKLVETEEENENFLMEALSQVSLISILESQVVEKGENMQVMDKQLKALEGEHQRILEEQISIKKRLKESESKLLETEEENETFLMEALSQVSLISILESQVVEKGENMQVMEKQLKSLQGKIAKVEYWLQTCGSNPQMRENESWQLQQWICGFQDQGIKYETVSKTDKELQQEISILTEESSQLKCHMQVRNEDNMIDSLHDLGEKQQEHGKISCRSIQNGLQSMPKEVKEQGKYREMGLHSQELDVQVERLHESPHSSESQETNSAGEHRSYGSGARSKVPNLKSQISEPNIRVRDLEEENMELKCQTSDNCAGASSMGKGYLQFEEQNSQLVLVEGPSNDQEEKQDIVDEEKDGMSTEDKKTYGIYCLQEQNQKLWSRFDSANLQLNKLQITFQELQEKFWKTRHDNQKAKAGGQTGKQTSGIEKEFRELQNEILLWLECNYMMMKELQHRFVSVNKLQLEFTAVKGGHNRDPSEDTVIDVSQAAKLQKEILTIQEENNKIADVLRSGSDQARRLEFEVEKILLRFQGETKSTDWHKKANYPRRTSLRTFLFGKEEQKQKRKASFGCMHPIIHK